MTRSQLELQIEQEKQSVERLRETLLASQRLVNRLESVVNNLSDNFEHLNDALQPFHSSMKSFILAEKCTLFCD